MVTGRTVWGPQVPTLKGTEASLSHVQYFLYPVSSPINASIFHGLGLDTSWTGLYALWMHLVMLDLTKMKTFFSYALSCSKKEVKFSIFFVLSIRGCQNGSQTLLSKFSPFFTRTEQAEKWEAPCTHASASDSAARVSHADGTAVERSVCGNLFRFSCQLHHRWFTYTPSLSLKVP